jgi:hypothetical protein
VTEYTIPLAALVITIATLVLSERRGRTTLSLASMADLRGRIHELERNLTACYTECDSLRKENIEMLRRLAQVPWKN